MFLWFVVGKNKCGIRKLVKYCNIELGNKKGNFCSLELEPGSFVINCGEERR